MQPQKEWEDNIHAAWCCHISVAVFHVYNTVTYFLQLAPITPQVTNANGNLFTRVGELSPVSGSTLNGP